MTLRGSDFVVDTYSTFPSKTFSTEYPSLFIAPFGVSLVKDIMPFSIVKVFLSIHYFSFLCEGVGS